MSRTTHAHSHSCSHSHSHTHSLSLSLAISFSLSDFLSLFFFLTLSLTHANITRIYVTHYTHILTHMLYVGPSSSLVGEKTHPAMYTYLNQNFSHWKTQRQVEASLVGFRLDPFICNKLIFPWEKCALQEACIAPAGSSRKNHRQDQSVLSYLIHSTWDLKTGFNIELQHPPPTSYFTTDFKHDGVQCKCDRNLYKLTGYIFAYSFYQWMCGTNVE